MEYKVSEKKKISVTIPSLGKTYSLTKPNLAAQEAYEEALAEASEKKKSMIKPMVQFLVGSGLPEADAKQLDGDEYTEVIQFILGSKKN